MKPNEALMAISPTDGRYQSKTSAWRPYFSEYGLIRFRVQVEIEYLLALSQLGLEGMGSFTDDQQDALRALIDDFREQDAQAIKEIEKTTNHDVKAVEYWLGQKLTELGLEDFIVWVHFALTSQDINNTAVPMSIQAASRALYEPQIRKMIERLRELAQSWKDISILSRTHGQAASPSALGKEIEVFASRLELQFKRYEGIPHSGKFGGATGNFNAHISAYPNQDWVEFGNNFLRNNLNLERQQFTTQIEHYDGMAERFDAIKRINTILIDLCRDIWTYISMDYFKQKTLAGEVGSSTMPHKVNPIDFENAEGNLGLANAMLEHLSSKLPISRLQRDLTDSTVSRNIGLPFAWTQIALSSLEKGLSKLLVNEAKITEELERHWIILAEPIQTILRREGFPNAYEMLKDFTRGKSQVDKQDLLDYIDRLDVSESVKSELRELHPLHYVGNAKSI
jgi:adenylosuccinate lyase